jgi:nitroreductase
MHELLQSRHSPRAFADQPVAADVQERLFEAARWAPSCFNEQPWRFVVTDRFADPEGHAAMVELLTGWNKAWAPHAAMLVVAGYATTFARNGNANDWAAHDLGAAVSQLTLQATAEGLVVHQMGGVVRDAAHDALGFPDDVVVLTAIAIGHPGDPATLPENLQAAEAAPRVRKDAAEIVFRGRYGS